MIKRFQKTERSQIMVEPVALTQVHQYGIVDCQGVFCPQGNWAPIRRIVENLIQNKHLLIFLWWGAMFSLQKSGRYSMGCLRGWRRNPINGCY